jgi:hypothetical protein
MASEKHQEAVEKLRAFRAELGTLQKTIAELRVACHPPQRIAELESALDSIRGNAIRPDASTDATLLPWIVQRCEGVLNGK